MKCISAMVFSNELKEPELNGLLDRNVQADKHRVIVEHIAAEYDQTLADIIATLTEWGHQHKRKLTKYTEADQ